MNTIDFLKPHLVGERFDDHTIPLEILKDFAALEEMLIEMTKFKYFEENPERKRVPRGFMDGITLKLKSVEPGSAIPHISLEINQQSPNLFTTDYITKSRDSIILGINAAENDENIHNHIPEYLLGYFDRIGRSLHDDEIIEFQIPGRDEEKATLNKTIRKKLLLSSSRLSEVTDEINIRGVISEVDQAKMTFELQLDSGQKVASPISLEYLDTVMNAFQGYRQNIKVLVHGIGKFNRSDKLQSIESVEHISILDSLDIPSRLDELRSLENDWLNEKSLVPTKEQFQWFLESFESNFSDELPLPYLYPTAEGNLHLEWELDHHDISLEIDMKTHIAEWHDYSFVSDDYEMKDLNLDKPEDWEFIHENLNKLIFKKERNES